MTAEYIQEGNNLDYTNATETAIAAGTLVVMGEICGIAACTIQPGETGVITTTGVWSLPKDDAAITAGAKVYYDDDAGEVTATASSNTFIGIAAAAAAAGDTAAAVRLNG